jgi:hypothetical protein
MVIRSITSSLETCSYSFRKGSHNKCSSMMFRSLACVYGVQFHNTSSSIMFKSITCIHEWCSGYSKCACHMFMFSSQKNPKHVFMHGCHVHNKWSCVTRLCSIRSGTINLCSSIVFRLKISILVTCSCLVRRRTHNMCSCMDFRPITSVLAK